MQNSKEIKEVLIVLKEQFEDTSFGAEFDTQLKKWIIYCGDFFVYNSVEYKEALKAISEVYEEIKFFSCVIHKLTFEMLKTREKEFIFS